jgi:hypothetical protein
MNLIELNRSLVQLRLNEVIGEDVIVEYEGNYCTEDAVIWLRQKPRTIGELRSEEIDWLRWMAANTNSRDLLEKLSQDSDPDVRMWVACNPLTSRLVLEKLAEDPIVFVRRGVAQNKSTPAHLLIKLNADPDTQVRILVQRNTTNKRTFQLS